jgi:hypothetical protein
MAQQVCVVLSAADREQLATIAADRNRPRKQTVWKHCLQQRAGRDHLIAGYDPEPEQGQMQRGRAARDSTRMRRADVGRGCPGAALCGLAFDPRRACGSCRGADPQPRFRQSVVATATRSAGSRRWFAPPAPLISIRSKWPRPSHRGPVLSSPSTRWACRATYRLCSGWRAVMASR